MNRTQKSAWFGLTMSMLLLVLIAVHALVVKRPSQFSNLLWLLPIFGLVALPIISLRRKHSQGEVDIDERDSCISKKALIAAFSSTCGLLVAACMIPAFIVGPTGSIPVCLLPALLYSLFLVFILGYSVAILVQYGWGGKDGKK